ncbi:ATP-binding protein [Micromonospora sp. CPCC 205714]|uniref:ATP-binding protein n=1 Tax=Micromonospora sp. CPCC 205714 TaxID=3122402 RepID=UPI002FEF24B2
MDDDAGTTDPGLVTPGPAAGSALLSEDFTADSVTALRHRLQAAVSGAGLLGDVGYDFVLAVHELATNAVRHGGGRGHLDLRGQDDVLICEVSDHGAAGATLPVRPPAVDVAGGRGLWLAHRLTEGLLLVGGVDGVTATVTACLDRDDRPPVAGGATPEPGRTADGDPT